MQRILLHADIAAEATSRLVEATQVLVSGDPHNEDTFVGPLIDEKEAVRLHEWITSAVEAGATLLCGGDRDGAVLAPTLLTNVPKDHPLYAEEAFGPVAVLETVPSFEVAINRANDSRFGIHAGVFTNRIQHAMLAWDRLEVGGVLINEMPSWRVDNLPYGGVKDSGLGREGIRYAMEDMTEIRSLVIRDT